MATAEMLRPYVEQKIAEYLGIEKVALDADGDIPIKAGSAVCYARLFDSSNGPIFRAFSPLLLDVPKTEALLERLNGLNQTAQYVRFFWQAEQVYCSVDLPAEDLQPSEIHIALLDVSVSADRFDHELKGEFGGRRMLEDEVPPKPTGTDGEGAAQTAASPGEAGGPASELGGTTSPPGDGSNGPSSDIAYL